MEEETPPWFRRIGVSEHRDATKFLDVHDIWFDKSTPSTRLAVATGLRGIITPCSVERERHTGPGGVGV